MAGPARRAQPVRRDKNRHQTHGVIWELIRREVAQRNRDRAWYAESPNSCSPSRQSVNKRCQNDSTGGSHRRQALVQSQALPERDPFSQKMLHLRRVRVGILMANAVPCDFAGELMQIERHFQALLAGHALILLNLFLESRFGFHVYLNDSAPFLASTLTVWPSRTLPSRM